MAEGEPIAAGEARRLGRRALELVDHLALGHGEATKRHRESDLFGKEFNLDFAKADFARKWMRSPKAALGRVAERQQEAFVAAREILKSKIAVGGERQRVARKIADRRGRVGVRRLLD